VYIRLYAWYHNRKYKTRYIYIYRIRIFQPCGEMNNLQATAGNKTREGWRNIKLYFKVEMGWWFQILNLDYNSRIICTFSIVDENSWYQMIETILPYHNILWRFFLFFPRQSNKNKDISLKYILYISKNIHKLFVLKDILFYIATHQK